MTMFQAKAWRDPASTTAQTLLLSWMDGAGVSESKKRQ
jgi:hypothetical protein